MSQPELSALAPVILYRTLGSKYKETQKGAVPIWLIASKLAMKSGDAVRKAGHEGEGVDLGESLFETIMNSPSGVDYAKEDHDASFSRVRRAGNRINLCIPELKSELDSLKSGPTEFTSEEFPFILSAGERRDYTANGLYRDPKWRKKGAECALRINPGDADALKLENGSRVKITTRAGCGITVVEITDTLQPGHITLPNGVGLSNNLNEPDAVSRVGVSTNDLTSLGYRDFLAGTPWHKSVPAQLKAMD